MPLITYVDRRFQASSLEIIERANAIIEDYQAQDLILTLRQLYYRFVAAGFIDNLQREYKRLGSVINDARLAGCIDWLAIEDRGRSLIERSHWDDPADIINSAAKSYAIDKWEGQQYVVEVWVEKQALESVVDRACKPLDVSCYACKGYVSQSEMWRAAGRFRGILTAGRQPVVIHLGDHDPSGIDMTRDIRDRLEIFRVPMEINRIALNMNQVEEYRPPPNPAKITDSRARGYILEYGSQSWELDALEPSMLNQLIQQTIRSYLDEEEFAAREEQQERERLELIDVADRWDYIVEGE